jgi:tetratricopeptide (TPR) repeat protein
MNSGFSELNRDRARQVALVLTFVTFLVYLPACFHDFIDLDDLAYVSENQMVRAGLSWAGLKWAFTTMTGSNWHPLTWLSHMLDCQLFGLNAGAQHCVNLLLHTANTVLLFLFWLRTTRALWAAAFVAALFAWHPLHVESVAWIAERKDVLSTLLGLLALIFYARFAQEHTGRQPSGVRCLMSRHYGAAVLFFALGLLAKPMLVTLPFVFLLLDWWPLRRTADSACNAPVQQPLAPRPSCAATSLRLILEKWPFFLLTAASCVVTFLAQRQNAVVPVRMYPVGLRFSNAAVSYVRYLKKAIWPTDLALMYPLPRKWPLWEVLAATAFLLSLSVVAWRARRRRPCFFTGWFWFVGTLVPAIGLVQVGPQAIADRYTYLPLVGVFVAVAYGVRDFAARVPLTPAQLSAAAGLVLAGCIAATEIQLRYWRNTELLLKRTLAVTSNNTFAHVVLSTTYARQRRYDEASVEFAKAARLEESPFVETAVERDYRVRTYLLLAQIFEMRRPLDEALNYYRDALRLDPASVEAHNNLGNLLDKMGRKDEAMAQYREALRLRPEAPLAHDNLGTLLIQLGRFEDGMREYTEAARLKPDDPLPHYLMGKAWLRHGQSAKAVLAFQESLRRDPDDFHTATYAARVLATDPDPAVRNGVEAVKLAERANTLSNGAQPLVLDTLAMAYAEAGRFHDAQNTLRRAIELAQAAGVRDWERDMQQRLRLYQAASPYREASTNVLSAPVPGDNSRPHSSAPPAPGGGSTP